MPGEPMTRRGRASRERIVERAAELFAERGIAAADGARSRRFHTDVLGGGVLRDGEPSIIALANSWIIINAERRPAGQGDTPDLARHTGRHPAPSRRPRKIAAQEPLIQC